MISFFFIIGFFLLRSCLIWSFLHKIGDVTHLNLEFLDKCAHKKSYLFTSYSFLFQSHCKRQIFFNILKGFRHNIKTWTGHWNQLEVAKLYLATNSFCLKLVILQFLSLLLIKCIGQDLFPARQYVLGCEMGFVHWFACLVPSSYCAIVMTQKLFKITFCIFGICCACIVVKFLGLKNWIKLYYLTNLKLNQKSTLSV